MGEREGVLKPSDLEPVEIAGIDGFPGWVSLQGRLEEKRAMVVNQEWISRRSEMECQNSNLEIRGSKKVEELISVGGCGDDPNPLVEVGHKKRFGPGALRECQRFCVWAIFIGLPRWNAWWLRRLQRLSLFRRIFTGPVHRTSEVIIKTRLVFAIDGRSGIPLGAVLD